MLAINDFSRSFASFSYNIRMQRKDTVSRKLQSATAYVESIQELYQRKEALLEIVQSLHVVVSLLQEIRREVLLQELISVLHDEVLPVESRKEKVVKLFQFIGIGKKGKSRGKCSSQGAETICNVVGESRITFNWGTR